MWLCTKVCGAAFIVTLVANMVIVPTESFVTSYPRSDLGDSYNVIAQESDAYRTWMSSQARFLNFGNIGRLGGYFSRFFQYFENGMNYFFGEDERWNGKNRKVRYNRYQLLRVTPRTNGQVEDVMALRDEVDGLMYWTQPTKNHSADILVPPGLVADVKQFLHMRGLEFVVLFKDIQVSSELGHCRNFLLIIILIIFYKRTCFSRFLRFPRLDLHCLIYLFNSSYFRLKA